MTNKHSAADSEADLVLSYRGSDPGSSEYPNKEGGDSRCNSGLCLEKIAELERRIKALEAITILNQPFGPVPMPLLSIKDKRYEDDE